MSAVLASPLIVEDWESPGWRLDNLYTIVDDESNEIPFRMNADQRRFFENIWYWNLILKARQVGYTTLVALMALDQCLFNNNFTAGIIAHHVDDVEKIFKKKIRFAWRKLPRALRENVGVESETGSAMTFGNGSNVSVGTSMRSGTLNLLHVSEFGKICAKYPEKAREIVTGSFPTLRAGQILIVESTAEGQAGYFYEYTTSALRSQQEGRKESALDFRLHFTPWHSKDANRIDPEGVLITPEWVRYFEILETRHHVKLDAAQKAWYVKTGEVLKGDMGREHPSYPEEAFAQSLEGAYFTRQMAQLRKAGRIGTVPWDPAYPVDTCWDLGVDDTNAIWCIQQVGLETRAIRYYENSGEGLGHYVNEIGVHGYTWGTHYLPHDADNRLQGENITTRADILRGLISGTVSVVDRIREIGDGIEKTRTLLPLMRIDAEGCAQGIKSLDHYQKEWNEKLGAWRNKPLHNWACLGPDTRIRTLSGWRRIEDLEGQEFHVWGYSEVERRLVPAKASKCWRSKRDAEVVRVMIDDGRSIICTPDHLFLTRTGEWVEARTLQPGQSLMPFYERFDTDYVKVRLNDGSTAYEHQYVFARLNGPLLDGHHIHHRDGDKGNNSPDNLEQLTIFEHRSRHSSTPEHIAHLRRVGSRRGNTAILTAVNKLRSGDAHHTRSPGYWTEERRRLYGAASSRAFKASERMKRCEGCGETFIGNWKRVYCCNNCKARAADHRSRGSKVKFSVAHRHTKECVRVELQNHKVVMVEKLDERIDVFDIEVPGIHCFVAEGVVVHNSHAADALRQYAQGYKPHAHEEGFTRHRSSWRA